MIRISDIIETILSKNPQANVDLVDRAYIFSAKVHDGQVRLSGEPYLSHPLEVAGVLADMGLDCVSIAAGLLHDVIEDTHATAQEIGDMFGADVLHIVSGVTKLSRLKFKSSQAAQAESIRKMLLAMADDLRVILIKLADRLHNMRTLQYHHNMAKRKKIAQETLDIYAPLAARLGIYWIKNELEDNAFKYLYPDDFADIQARVSKDKAGREKYVETVKKIIRQKMGKAGLTCTVLGRYKKFYSIYRKMEDQNLPFEEIYDIIAFRVILDSIPQCYAALGLVHSLWKPVDRKIKDYIGRPKPNMYQSLHTTVIGPFGDRIEIQIRTWEMDNVAKSGIAAHWSYKEGKHIDDNISQTYAWIQGLIANNEHINDPNEFLENVRIDLFPDEVYVFTPNGEIRSLPRGASPVDFAYMIHTEVGHQCIGAKIDGRIVPLPYELKTGDVIEIITQKNHHPSSDWLTFVKTSKARSRIRQWIKVQEKDRSISLGREMCEKAFRKHRLNFNALSKSDQMPLVAEKFGFKQVEDLIASVGYGKHTPLQLIREFEPRTAVDDDSDSGGSLIEKLIGRVRRKKAKAGVLVNGQDDILIRFGKCCRPVPGDSIIGYITQGQGVSVHRANCTNALRMNPDRMIEVDWNAEKNESYPVHIRVTSYDRVGLLADLAANLSKVGANILSANTQTSEYKTVDSHFTIEVKDTDHLHRTISALKKIKGVSEIRRMDD